MCLNFNVFICSLFCRSKDFFFGNLLVLSYYVFLLYAVVFFCSEICDFFSFYCACCSKFGYINTI